MTTIHKYPLKVTDEQTIEMPKGAEILHIGNQNGNLCLWAKVDTRNPKEKTEIEISGTGHPLNRNLKYLGTAIITPFVWHVFERTQDVDLESKSNETPTTLLGHPWNSPGESH